MAVAFLINPQHTALLRLQNDEHKSVDSVRFVQKTGSSVNETIRGCNISEVFCAIAELVFAGDAVVSYGAAKLD